MGGVVLAAAEAAHVARRRRAVHLMAGQFEHVREEVLAESASTSREANPNSACRAASIRRHGHSSAMPRIPRLLAVVARGCSASRPRPRASPAQPPQGVLGFVVGQPERGVQRLVLVLQRERVVAVEVRIGGEQEEQLADAEGGGVDLGQDLGEPQRVRRPRVPGSRWPSPGSNPASRDSGSRFAVSSLTNSADRRSQPCRRCACSSTRVISCRTAHGHCAADGPVHSASRWVRSASTAPGTTWAAGSVSSMPNWSRSIWNAASCRTKSGLSRAARADRLQHVADVPQLREGVAAAAGLRSLRHSRTNTSSSAASCCCCPSGNCSHSRSRQHGSHRGTRHRRRVAVAVPSSLSSLLSAAAAERHEARLPQLVELAVAQAGRGEERGQRRSCRAESAG